MISLLPVSFTHANAPFKELAFQRIACQRKRCAEVFAGCLMPSTAQFKLTQCRRIEWVCGKTIAVNNRTHLFESALRSVMLGNGDGAVKRNNGRGTHGHQ